MSFRERRKRTAAVKSEIHAARERLGTALRSMDYTHALACQMELDHLERDPNKSNHYLKVMRPSEACQAPVGAAQLKGESAPAPPC